jgi:hypothetical protein
MIFNIYLSEHYFYSVSVSYINFSFSVQAKTVYETMSMIEEFMLAANISSAERIYKDFPDCAMYVTFKLLLQQQRVGTSIYQK